MIGYLAVENHPQDSRVRFAKDNLFETLTSRAGTGGGNVPLVFCFEGNGQRPSHQGNGWREGEEMYTLNSTEQHAVSHFPSYGWYPQMKAECVTFTKEKSTCLVNGTNPGFQNGVMHGEGILRRLTPDECEMLQGLPMGWTDVNGASDSKRYKAIGNAMAIPCSDYILSKIVQVVKGEQT